MEKIIIYKEEHKIKNDKNIYSTYYKEHENAFSFFDNVKYNKNIEYIYLYKLIENENGIFDQKLLYSFP